MDNKLLHSVKKMHEKFGLANNGCPVHLSPEEKAFRIVALREEIDEYEASSNLVDEYDALIDLMVFAVGTFERQGLPLQKGFDTVMACNMKKELAGSSENSKRAFKRDLVKPQGWAGPEATLQIILDNANDKNLLLNERGSTHGDFSESSVFVQSVKDITKNSQNWGGLQTNQKEAIEMIIHKIGRIMYGDYNFKDHWADIAGYATLIEKNL